MEFQGKHLENVLYQLVYLPSLAQEPVPGQKTEINKWKAFLEFNQMNGVTPRYAIQLQENQNQKTNRPGPEKLQLFISSLYFIFRF